MEQEQNDNAIPDFRNMPESATSVLGDEGVHSVAGAASQGLTAKHIIIISACASIVFGLLFWYFSISPKVSTGGPPIVPALQPVPSSQRYR